MAERRRVAKTAETRRREILVAAQALFSERGFDTTTVADIAAAAGVATGTVYLYFPSKEHVLRALHDEFHEGLAQCVLQIAGEALEQAAIGAVDGPQIIDAVLDAIVAYTVERRRVCQVIVRYIPRLLDSEHPHGHDDFVQLLARAFEQGIAEGYLHASDPHMTALLLDAAMRATLGPMVAFGDPADVDRLLAAAKELFRKALTA